MGPHMRVCLPAEDPDSCVRLSQGPDKVQESGLTSAPEAWAPHTALTAQLAPQPRHGMCGAVGLSRAGPAAQGSLYVQAQKTSAQLWRWASGSWWTRLDPGDGGTAAGAGGTPPEPGWRSPQGLGKGL